MSGFGLSAIGLVYGIGGTVENRRGKNIGVTGLLLNGAVVLFWATTFSRLKGTCP
jgi:hypothetical protein